MAKSELVKGSTEMILLSLISERDMYGYEIAQQIEVLSEGFLRFREGTLYPALKRLENEGLVESYWQQSLEGPRRKYYSITRAGKKELADQKKEWSSFMKAMNRIVGVGNVQS